VFHGTDIDDTKMVKHIWTGQEENTSTVKVIVELNYFPLCGASLLNTGSRHLLELRDRRRMPHGHNDGYSQEQIDACLYFDDRPLRINIQEGHNARIFLSFPLSGYAGSPCIFMLRNNRPYIPVGLPNIFPEDGNLCAGNHWSDDTDDRRDRPDYSLLRHIKKALVAFSSTPPNYDLSNDTQHALWGTWDSSGNITPTTPPATGGVHTNTTVCSFVKHLIANPHA